ncbi:MAG: 30S ribosomal protein S12 methylthiotransferase RimO [Bacteroidota bacterium]|nr:30S ribosomal protein S12 methylthiotransferase RimO [Bacteroidota bacterium]
MKTKGKKDKVNIITLGCSKNLVDSEVLSGQLAAAKVAVSHESPKSDHNIVVINTCGFIDKAKQESIDTILEQVELKKQGRLEKVYVTGCLSERYRQDLEIEIPEVDAYFGTMELPALLRKFEVDYKESLVGERMLSTPGHYAYLKISEGCNRTCAFCAIPLMRGKHVSRTLESLVEEARGLVARGVREIMLIAQELTYYGLDIYKERALPRLLNALADIEGLEWIRLHYAYPTRFPMEIIEVMKERPNICNYLDIPLQHASDGMLAAMKRQITRGEMEELIVQIKDRIPGICLRTTFMVGFPGETLQDIEELKDFMTRMEFDRVGVFTYSHEESTQAHELKDSISEKEKQRRAEEIMELQQEISLKKNEEKIGSVLKVLIDRKEAGKYVGRTEFDSVEVDNEVIVTSATSLKAGDFVEVKITGAFDYDLKGEAISPSRTRQV